MSAIADPPLPARRGESPGAQALKALARSKTALLGAIALTLIIFGALFAGLLAPQNPYDLTHFE